MSETGSITLRRAIRDSEKRPSLAQLGARPTETTGLLLGTLWLAPIAAKLYEIPPTSSRLMLEEARAWNLPMQCSPMWPSHERAFEGPRSGCRKN